MYKRLLGLIFLFLLQNTSLSAMDFNQSLVIINDARESTQVLQGEFDVLLNEVITPIEVNNMAPSINEKIFGNNSIKTNSSIPIEYLESNKKLSCVENNYTILLNGLLVNLSENNTIEDNGCTDSNLGSSDEGLIIFKTRIKPYCKMKGETFAKQYMQEDWDDIYHDKEFKMEIIKACPKMGKRYRDKWTPDLYQFAVEYASDSDAIPEC